MKADLINTRRGKRAFIRSLTRLISCQVCKAVRQMPAHWDGHELREVLALQFERERTSLMRLDCRRKRAFDAEHYNINF